MCHRSQHSCSTLERGASGHVDSRVAITATTTLFQSERLYFIAARAWADELIDVFISATESVSSDENSSTSR